ncbi:MAG: exodeoxyribonuclease VII large subunit [Bifidobacterium crudilactis]|jgi:exodeoxyribonuclease VII large subunit
MSVWCRKVETMSETLFPTSSQPGYRSSGSGRELGGDVNPTAPAEIPRLARDTTAEQPWPVSVLSQKFHDAVSKWPGAWIEGQIVEINTRRSGSAYLTVRDNFEDISISVMGFRQFAVMARDFHQGDRVVIHGHPDLWVKQTRLSFMADDIRRVGTGDLKQQIEELRKKLKGEGLFDLERKVPLPEFPTRIGLVCAPQARAEGDVITNARLRWPTIEFTVVHAHVQGPQCPPDVIAAIQRLDTDPTVDVIIVARGGGSFEDLLGFSDEGLVRAAASCQTPLVSAVGHEDDWTLIDLAADLRASTPTDAAKRAVPDVNEQLQIVAEGRRRIRDRITNMVGNESRLIEGYANRPSLTQPLLMLERPQRLVDEAGQRLDIALRRIVDDAGLTVEKLHASLTALSPQSTLNRGYAVVQASDGHVVDDSSSVHEGDGLTITLRHGTVVATAESAVEETTPARQGR